MKLLNFLALCSVVLVSYSAQAQPIFFTCEADKSISSVLTPRELANRINQLASSAHANPNTAIENVCNDVESCIRDFGRLLDLAKDAKAVGAFQKQQILGEAESRAAKLMNKMKSSGFLKISASDMEFMKSFQTLETMNYACQEAEETLPPESMKSDTTSCALGNFHHSPYMYVGGARTSGDALGEDEYKRKITCSSIDYVIDGAIAMGQDPYSALAIAFMEQGTDIKGLYLDPIGIVGALGCSSSSVGNAEIKKYNAEAQKCTESTNKFIKANPGNIAIGTRYSECTAKIKKPYNLESYQTFYEVQYRDLDNEALASKLRDYVALKNSPIKDKPSKLCGGGDDSLSDGKLKQCCLKLPFTADNEVLQNGLTFSSLKHYVTSPLTPEQKGSDPSEDSARRLQRYNGWSKLMGGAETVPAWRSGVNYYKTPTYGLQAADFILNSLLTNPYVRSKIEAAQEKLHRKVPNVFCEDLAAGSYSIDSRFFFQKHANAPRMESVVQSWNFNGHNWKSLSPQQQNVMKNELASVCSQHAKAELLKEFSKRMSATEANQKVEKFCKYVDYDYKNPQEFLAKGEQELNNKAAFYLSDIIPLRKTVAAASHMDFGYTWSEMNDDQFAAFLKRTKGYQR